VLLDRYSFVVTTTYDVPAAANGSASAASAPPALPGELSRDFEREGLTEVAKQKSTLSGWTVATFMPRDALAFPQRWLALATVALLLLACALAIGLGFAYRARPSRVQDAA